MTLPEVEVLESLLTGHGQSESHGKECQRTEGGKKWISVSNHVFDASADANAQRTGLQYSSGR